MKIHRIFKNSGKLSDVRQVVVERDNEGNGITNSNMKIPNYNGCVPAIINIINAELNYAGGSHTITEYITEDTDVIDAHIYDLLDIGFPSIFPLAIHNDKKMLLAFDMVCNFRYRKCRIVAIVKINEDFIILPWNAPKQQDYTVLDSETTDMLSEIIADNFIIYGDGYQHLPEKGIQLVNVKFTDIGYGGFSKCVRCSDHEGDRYIITKGQSCSTITYMLSVPTIGESMEITLTSNATSQTEIFVPYIKNAIDILLNMPDDRKQELIHYKRSRIDKMLEKRDD